MKKGMGKKGKKKERSEKNKNKKVKQKTVSKDISHRKKENGEEREGKWEDKINMRKW